MSGDDAPRALYLLLLIMLVGSSLVGMRLPVGKAVKMLLAWVAIFGVGFMLFAFRGDFGALGQKLRSEATGAPIISGETVRIAQKEDGHFWVEAEVNGHRAAFLVDSGATITTVDRATADAARLETGMRVNMVETANGVVPMVRGEAREFQLGPIVREELAVNVNERDGANVLGMNFLSTLSSWSVEGNTLVLRS